ncbi:MAG: hypothetical protein H6684_07795 [Deltaproteobacteria bacterium]|nr:hypothetical protein [bacterium]MCB9479426.1 hypothetical protein [Deltaproteobacteria bacterium]MCB9488616.1 hypothetical protein [Deltaproteobacteria bacterium]
MATLQIRNMPDDLMEKLQERAKRERRSVSAQAITELQRTLDEPHDRQKVRELLKRADELRAKTKLHPGTPEAVEMIRRDRDRDHEDWA